MKAKDFDKKFDDGEDVSDALDASKAKRAMAPDQERIELSLTKSVVEEAEELGLDVEALCRKGIQDAVDVAKKKAAEQAKDT
jgi:hypothetical protein